MRSWRGAGTHRYRVTVEHVHSPRVGEPLDPPTVFETSNQDALMLLFIVSRMGPREDVCAGEDTIVFDTPPAPRGSTRPM